LYFLPASVHFVLAREVPRRPNWIQTFAHDRNFLMRRMPGVTNPPLPSVRRVSLAETASQSGASTPGIEWRGGLHL